MESELRAAGVFTGVGVVLVGAAIVVTHMFPPKSGVDALPAMEPPMAASPPATSAAHGQPTASLASPADVPRLLQRPTLSKTQVAFDFAGEIWTVPREGGDARSIVHSQLRNFRPLFSPDGSQIAFTGVLDENADVYVVSANGGEPHRLTYHPGGDVPVGWTPDGKRILFRSTRATTRDLPHLFTVAATGGAPEEVPLASGQTGSYSPDAARLAYVPFQQWQPAWRKYRGGQTTPIWLADLATSHVTKVPRPKTDSNDRSPMWVGDSVYFLSDRNGPFTLFAYDVKAASVREVVKNPDGFDMANASAGPGGIVYDQMGDIFLFDLASSATHKVPITISAELPSVRPHFEHVEPSTILHAAISPTGKRVLLETRGEILSAPVDKGDVRNLTHSPGVADRDPAWSPDGKWVAWLSDESGEYALYFRAPDGQGPTKKISLGDPPSYFYSPTWSPDSKKLLLHDKRLNLWLVDTDHAASGPVKLDTGRYDHDTFDESWSPDSRFIAYVKELENRYHAIFVYSMDDKKITQLTDGRSDAQSPRFDRGGKYLWFTASTDVGPAGASSMASMTRPTTNNVYGIVLEKEEPSPVAPESDEEGDAGAGVQATPTKGEKDDKADKAAKKAEKTADKKAKEAVKIDFDGIDQRIVSLPIDRANYYDLEAGEKGVLFLLSGPVVRTDEDYVDSDHDTPIDVLRFELKTRKVEPFASKIDGDLAGGGGTFMVSADGKKVLYCKGHKWFVAPAEKGKDAETLKLDGAEIWVDPRAEWKQIFHEVWRVERDFLYDPHAHGLDIAAAEKLYGRYLDGIADRDDLNDLMEAGLGNLVLGHVWAQGGAVPKQRHVNVGMLGADYKIEAGHYRIARILSGENWNPKMRAPLTEPGVKVSEGDFLLAVNGDPVTATADDDVYRAFLGRAEKQTAITVGPSADGSGSRTVTVVPVGSETGLRLRTWMENNRKKVFDLSKGRVGYVYIPDTGGNGLTNFDRYYYSQTGKDAVVLDERFNHGGQLADYIVEVLARTPLLGAATREGEDRVIPSLAVFGPKVMIANQMSGSGGDALPWLFKRAGLGPVVGTRTWGGLVGIGGYPTLVDGGRITAPRFAIYGIHGEWEVENHGVAPDVELDQDPEAQRQGHDPQL